MGLANSGGAHEQQTLFGGARVVANKSLRQKLCFFQRIRLQRRCADVRAVAFKITVLVAPGDVRALDDPLGALLHPAIAGHGNSSRGSVGPRHELPARSSAKRAILKSHAHSIRSGRVHGKLSRLGKLWKGDGARHFSLPLRLTRGRKGLVRGPESARPEWLSTRCGTRAVWRAQWHGAALCPLSARTPRARAPAARRWRTPSFGV